MNRQEITKYPVHHTHTWYNFSFAEDWEHAQIELTYDDRKVGQANVRRKVDAVLWTECVRVDRIQISQVKNLTREIVLDQWERIAASVVQYATQNMVSDIIVPPEQRFIFKRYTTNSQVRIH